MEKMVQRLKKLNISLSQKQIEQFHQYYELLIEKNKVMNLTTITELDEVIDKHFIDSLAIVTTQQWKENKKIIDIGTGAGFPGIPLKIAFPELAVVLLDSLNKRVKFLEEVIQVLGLEKIEAIHGRAEDFAREKAYREQFDLCVSRAVANLATLSEYCLPYVKIGGKFISYKSAQVREELKSAQKAVQLLGGEIKGVEEFTLPDTEIRRTFILIEKKNKTQKVYPRKSGMPSKQPLS